MHLEVTVDMRHSSHIKCRWTLGSQLKIMDVGQRRTYQEEGGAGVLFSAAGTIAALECGAGSTRDMGRRRETGEERALHLLRNQCVGVTQPPDSR